MPSIHPNHLLAIHFPLIYVDCHLRKYILPEHYPPLWNFSGVATRLAFKTQTGVTTSLTANPGSEQQLLCHNVLFCLFVCLFTLISVYFIFANGSFFVPPGCCQPWARIVILWGLRFHDQPPFRNLFLMSENTKFLLSCTSAFCLSKCEFLFMFMQCSSICKSNLGRSKFLWNTTEPSLYLKKTLENFSHIC